MALRKKNTAEVIIRGVSVLICHMCYLRIILAVLAFPSDHT